MHKCTISDSQCMAAHDREHETKKRANDASREENKVVLRTTRSEKQCFQDQTRHVVFNQNAARNSKQEIGFLPGVLRPIQASSQVAFHCNVHTTTTLARHLRADGRRRFCPPRSLSTTHLVAMRSRTRTHMQGVRLFNLYSAHQEAD